MMLKINQLEHGMCNCTFVAKKISLSDMRMYKNNTSKWFSFIVGDETGKINVVVFMNDPEKLYNKIQNFINIKICKGKIRLNNKTSILECILDHKDSDILEWGEPINVPQNFVNIKDVKNFVQNCGVDIKCVIVQIFDQRELKNGNFKQDVKVEDKTGKIILVLWKKINQNLKINDVILINSCKVSIFDGAPILNFSVNSKLEVIEDQNFLHEVTNTQNFKIDFTAIHERHKRPHSPSPTESKTKKNEPAHSDNSLDSSTTDDTTSSDEQNEDKLEKKIKKKEKNTKSLKKERESNERMERILQKQNKKIDRKFERDNRKIKQYKQSKDTN